MASSELGGRVLRLLKDLECAQGKLQSLFAPGGTRALALEFFVHRPLQLLDFLQQHQFLADLHLLQG